MSQEKTQPYKGLFSSILAEFEANKTNALYLSKKELEALTNLNEKLPTATLSCNALISQLMFYKTGAFTSDVKQAIHALIVKILFTFIAFQDNAAQKALVELLTPLFKELQDDEWDKLLLNLKNIAETELPSSNNVHVLFAAKTNYAAFIKTLLQFSAQDSSIVLNQTFIVNLLIAGAEQAETYAKSNQKGALAFTDEAKINAFIAKNFDTASKVTLLKLYEDNLLKSKLIDCLQKKSFPLNKELSDLKEEMSKTDVDVAMLLDIGDTEYQNFSSQFASFKEAADDLAQRLQAVQNAADMLLSNSQELKKNNVLSLIEKAFNDIWAEYRDLIEGRNAYKVGFYAKINALRAQKEASYHEFTQAFNQFNAESNQSLTEIAALKRAFSEAKEAKLIPLTQEDDASYEQNIGLVEKKFAAIDANVGLIEAFQAARAKIVDSEISVAEFAKLTLAQQYQVYEKFEKDFNALKQSFSEGPLALSDPRIELKKIKETLNNRITLLQESLVKNQGDSIDLASKKAGFLLDAQKITELQSLQAELSQINSSLVKKLETACEVFVSTGVDGNFHPFLKELADIILWLFFREGLPEDSWLVKLKAFSEQQKKLKNKMKSANKVKQYLSIDSTEISDQGTKKNTKKKLLEEMSTILTSQNKDFQAESRNNLLVAINALRDNEAELQKNADLLGTSLKPYNGSTLKLTQEISANDSSFETVEASIATQKAKLADLKKVDSIFLALLNQKNADGKAILGLAKTQKHAPIVKDLEGEGSKEASPVSAPSFWKMGPKSDPAGLHPTFQNEAVTASL